MVLSLIISLYSCKERYLPPNGSLSTPLLVVEANLDPSGNTTSILLSRTTNVNDPALIKTENNAIVTVEGQDNSVYPLLSQGNGYYNGNLNLDMNIEYRLRIKASGKEYLSEYIRSVANPPLDSISWRQDNEGVRIFMNTNDPANVTKYFRWDYMETWEIRSFFFSDYIFQNNVMRLRNFPAENIGICWKYSPSTQIFLANSAQLQSGIISSVPVVEIRRGNEKLFWRYSIIAKQYALDKGGYDFFEIMKKNTEDIGSFFGPLPSELKGNIHCLSDPTEQVVGYVTSSPVTEKRIFISRVQLSNWPDFTICEEFRIPNNIDSIKNAIYNSLVPITYLPIPENKYTFANTFCVDCTSRGGSNVRPLYW